jgi:hypothetical protein
MKTLKENEQVQRMLQSQQRMAERDNAMIRKKQSEMLKKHEQREAEKKAAEIKK